MQMLVILTDLCWLIIIIIIIIPLFKCQAKIAVNKPLNGDTKINL